MLKNQQFVLTCMYSSAILHSFIFLAGVKDGNIFDRMLKLFWEKL
jgi:hypothetical protein